MNLTPFQQTLDWSGCTLGLAGAYLLALRLPVSRYGWIAFFSANVAYIAMAGQLGLLGFLAQQLGFVGSSALGIYRNFLASRSGDQKPQGGDEVDGDLLQAWSISARFAATPPSYLEAVPADLAQVIRWAKSLHPEMARGALERELRGEPSALVP